MGLEVIIIAIVVIVAAVLVIAALRPNTFRMQRSIMVHAAPDVIYPLIADFRKWRQWSPFDRLDPNLQRSYTGAPEGVGAIYGYEGDKRVGAGRMEIVEAEPPRRILAKLDFLKPFEAHNMAEFTMEPRAGGTEVTWAMYGNQAFMFKLMGLVFSMEKMVGPQFEEGLANIKSVAEAPQTGA